MGFLIKSEALPEGTRVRVYDAVTKGHALATVIHGTAKRVTVRLDDAQDTTVGRYEMIFTLRASGRWIRRYQPDAWDSLRVWRAITLEEED